MTDQSPNDLFHASSFMQGHNAEYLEQLYARYANDPNAVDEAWQAFFSQLGDGDQDVKREAEGPALGAGRLAADARRRADQRPDRRMARRNRSGQSRREDQTESRRTGRRGFR
ncbi:MAG: hypothetical protein R8G60_12035 [Roseovarius pacificus]|nr:hypothetical protein [Roseovarius pacificus]